MASAREIGHQLCHSRKLSDATGFLCLEEEKKKTVHIYNNFLFPVSAFHRPIKLLCARVVLLIQKAGSFSPCHGSTLASKSHHHQNA